MSVMKTLSDCRTMARLGQLPMQEPQRAQSSVSMVNGMSDLP
jgi:hypothetical protein